mmetsp:Transcript_89044/g.272683  ORF Transcript_89044/g.272683 Transcript_89044/m.272683 type:complete len:569 (-) Transcript_89044:83-1789(-)
MGGACTSGADGIDPTLEKGAHVYGQYQMTIPDDMSSLSAFDARGDSHKRKCKIICTMGPSCWDVETLVKLIDRGMNICRLNFSHGDHEVHGSTVQKIREAAKQRPGKPVGILLDTKGPEIRTGFFKPEVGDKIDLKQGQQLKLVIDYSYKGDSTCIAVSYDKLCKSVKPGNTILCADGSLSLKVLSVGTDHVMTEVMNSVKLGERKNCNLPGVKVDLPVLQQKDIDDLVKFGVPQGVDFVAASFVQSAADVKMIRDTLCQDPRGRNIKIISKIENEEGLKNIDTIIESSDAIMVARGDLGMEIPPENVFLAQKMMIAKCNKAGKPVVTATQMLESMMASPAPTRAECSDIANAIIDGCDAVMLSGESAVGKYPTESVGMQRRVVEAAERQGGRANGAPATTWREVTLPPSLRPPSISSSNAILASATTLAQGLNAKAIICFTATGQSVQRLVQLRPPCPVLAVCPCLETARWLSLLRGVYATSDRDTQELAAKVENEGPYKVRFSDAMEIACRIAREKGLATETDDKLVVMARLPLFKPGELNAIRIASTLGPRAADGYGPELESSDE